MNTLKLTLVLLAVALFAAPAWAQVDLPFDMYGEKFVIDTSSMEKYLPLTTAELFGGRFETASADGQLYAEICWGGELIVGHYPDYVMTAVFNMFDWDYKYPHEESMYFPTFHPDNNHLAFTVKIYDPDRGGVCQADTTFDINDGSILYINISGSNATDTIVMIDINTGELEVLIEGGQKPSFSPDGRYLLYLADNDPERRQLAYYDMMTGESTILEDIVTGHNMSTVNKATFAPDSNSIYFVDGVIDSEDIEDHYQLFNVTLDGSVVTQLSNFQKVPGEMGISFWNVNISPDGEWAVLNASGLNSFLLLYELSSGRIFSLITGEEFSSDLHEVIEYENQFRDTYNCENGGLGISYSGGSPIHYEINDVPYNYYEFHLTRPSLVGWHPDGETMVILGQCPGPDLAMYYKSFDPMFYKSQPSAVAEAAPTAFPTIANYPNPFNPQTTLSFNLPSGGYTEIAVYNLAGQRVRDLVAAEMTPGAHEVVWNGRDMNGMPVSSGVFFSQLKTGDTVVTDRMTLVK